MYEDRIVLRGYFFPTKKNKTIPFSKIKSIKSERELNMHFFSFKCWGMPSHLLLVSFSFHFSSFVCYFFFCSFLVILLLKVWQHVQASGGQRTCIGSSSNKKRHHTIASGSSQLVNMFERYCFIPSPLATSPLSPLPAPLVLFLSLLLIVLRGSVWSGRKKY